MQASSALAKAAGLSSCLAGRMRPQGIVRARAQIDVDIVDVAHDVRIVAERRHDVLLRRRHVLAAARDDAEEFAVGDPLEQLLQRRREARAVAVRAMTDVALRMIPAEPGIGVPVDRAVRRDPVGRIAVLIERLAIASSRLRRTWRRRTWLVPRRARRRARGSAPMRRAHTQLCCFSQCFSRAFSVAGFCSSQPFACRTMPTGALNGSNRRVA